MLESNDQKLMEINPINKWSLINLRKFLSKLDNHNLVQGWTLVSVDYYGHVLSRVLL